MLTLVAAAMFPRFPPFLSLLPLSPHALTLGSNLKASSFSGKLQMGLQLSVRTCRTPPPKSLPPGSCTLPIADSTTAGRFSGNEQMMSATSRMRIASRTDDPPNL
eukprot:351175-Chlamydomonas_euryale.AAC.3